jgi:hypothetical protein
LTAFYKTIRCQRRGLQHLIDGYEIPVVEVDGEIGEIIKVFIRINSTGKALTRQEQRHARYYNSAFLTQLYQLGEKSEQHQGMRPGGLHYIR